MKCTKCTRVVYSYQSKQWEYHRYRHLGSSFLQLLLFRFPAANHPRSDLLIWHGIIHLANILHQMSFVTWPSPFIQLWGSVYELKALTGVYWWAFMCYGILLPFMDVKFIVEEFCVMCGQNLIKFIFAAVYYKKVCTRSVFVHVCINKVDFIYFILRLLIVSSVHI